MVVMSQRIELVVGGTLIRFEADLFDIRIVRGVSRAIRFWEPPNPVQLAINRGPTKQLIQCNSI